MVKERQSNFELCRLASILLVMLVHTTYTTLGSNICFGVLLLEGFSIIGVNVFVMLTGYFSTSPKKSNLINLAFICLFWMIVRVGILYAFGEPLKFKYAFFITSSNWFIPSYIGLLFLTPMLNSFCDSANKRSLVGGAIILIVLEIWFNWLPPTPVVKWGIQNGYSVLSFAILYLLARAIRLYGLPNWFKKASPLIYVGCSVVFAIMMYTLINTGHDSPRIVKWCAAYSNPIVILSSVAFLMMFEQIKIQSKFINHIAKSTLAVLLGHSAIFFLYQKQFIYIYNHFSGIKVVYYWALAITIVFCASIAIDQLRILLYSPVEKWMKHKIKNNEILPIDKQL